MAKFLDATVLDAIPVAIFVLGEDDRIEKSNAASKLLFGDNTEDRLVSDVVRHPDFHNALALSKSTHQAGRARLTLNTVSGSVSLLVQIAPLSDGKGATVAFEDQTALDQAAAIRRDFVANVSHELRTPLTALVGFIETLRGAARDDPAARERFLSIMERESGRMIRLVNDLLSLSRVEAEEFRRPSELVDIGGLLRSVITTQRDGAEAAGVTISLDLDPAAKFVRGDPDQLMQVFHNLMENGVKYGGSGGRLNIRCARLEREPKLRGPAVSVEVADEGEGIDPIHLPRLTERFYRVDSHRSREKGGTGLGLAIVKHIVNRHRGRLKIESEPGKGSKFIVILPEL